MTTPVLNTSLTGRESIISDRIEMNVTEQIQKIAISIAYDCLVAFLKQMPWRWCVLLKRRT
jgi:hypothetical protein